MDRDQELHTWRKRSNSTEHERRMSAALYVPSVVVAPYTKQCQIYMERCDSNRAFETKHEWNVSTPSHALAMGAWQPTNLKGGAPESTASKMGGKPRRQQQTSTRYV